MKRHVHGKASAERPTLWLICLRHPWLGSLVKNSRSTSPNKIYTLRSLRCRSSSRARVCAAKIAPGRARMMCILPAEREPLRPDFVLPRRRAKPKPRVNSTFSDIVAPLYFAALLGGAANPGKSFLHRAHHIFKTCIGRKIFASKNQ